MPTVPSRDVLRAAYDTAIREIDASHHQPRLTTGFYAAIGNRLFDVCYCALEDFCAAQGAQGNQRPARLHVMSAPVGSGKTSFSKAFIAALVRLAARDANVPYGCVLVVDQIVKAHGMFKELSALLPGKVAIWTDDHDKKRAAGKKVKTAPDERFTKEELAEYPVAIVTHAFYSGRNGARAKQVLRNGALQPRALTVVDEQPEEVAIYDLQASEALRVQELLKTDAELAAVAGPHIDAFAAFMASRATCLDAPELERPTDNVEAWSVSDRLDWFLTPAAQHCAEALKKHAVNTKELVPNIDQVFALARALASSCVFITRAFGGQGEARFTGWSPKLMRGHGMVLLDGTADIDGVAEVSSWREVHPMPRARYDNLNIVHVPSITRQHLSKFLLKLSQREEYVEWMRAVIKEHMAPGQNGLVVCKKALFENGHVAPWSEENPYGWEIDGRHLDPPPNEWTPVVGSQSQEVSDGRTSTSLVHRGLQAASC